MSKRGLGTPNCKVPVDAEYIDFPRSDGDQRTWPRNTTDEVRDGEVNYMQALPIDHPVAIKWRLAVGNVCAVDIGGITPDKAILRGWPANYQLYDHHKGPANGNIRHDIYLYGPQSRRFRSPKEFAPHALWLCRDATMNTANCYCNGALETLVHTASQPSVPPSSGPGASKDADARPLTQGRDIYSALQKQGWGRRERDRDTTSLAKRRAHREQRTKEEAPKVFALKVSDTVLDMPMLATRNRDLRAMGVLSWDDDDETIMNPGVQLRSSQSASASNNGDPPLRRWFREGEVVWVRLPEEGIPLRGIGAPPNYNINNWPGIVKSSKIKNVPIPSSHTANGVANGPTYPPQPQGKQIASPLLSQDPTLNGRPPASPFPSRADLSGDPAQPLQPRQFSSAASSFRPQSSPSGALSSQSANVQIPSSIPHASSALANTSNGVGNANASPSPASRPPIPALPSRVRQSTPLAPSSEYQSTPSGNWSIKETVIYTIQLIGVHLRVEQPASMVLPYLADPPPEDFVEWLKGVPAEYYNFELDTIRGFDPVFASKRFGRLEDSEEDAKRKECNAISAYAFALQTASRMCNDWALTDKWDFHYVPPGYETGNVRVNVVSRAIAPAGESISSASTSRPQGALSPPVAHRVTTTTTTTALTQGLSLDSAIAAAGRANASGPSTFSSSKKMNLNEVIGSGPVYQEISGTSNSMDDLAVREMAVSALGIGPSLKTAEGTAGPSSGSSSGQRSNRPGALTQVRFQGMWWGTERIWVDDFVRIKLSRGALAPDGAPNVYQASGVGKKTLDDLEELRRRDGIARNGINGKGKEKEVDLPPPWLHSHAITQSANSRGIFLKIDGIFLVEVPKSDGKLKKEGRVCGMLYELAELTWEETEPDLKEQYEAEKKQRLEYLRQKEGTANFRASVDESLLPSSTNRPTGPQPHPLQPSPPGHYLIPQAPKGYRFRPILKAGYEAVLNLALILPVLAAPRPGGGKFNEFTSLFALEGLCAGHHNAVDPTFNKKSRAQMIEDAEQDAIADMDRHQEDIAGSDSDGDEDDSMDHGDDAESQHDMDEDLHGQRDVGEPQSHEDAAMNVD
ncbi:hypothetical protein DFP72DRAFT_879139 [Ephemerocybe angulata]|uniref:Cryptic loci regulator 2 C-terminal domain-containing protein n=1 Tax=Ephemerocybe angulata TaxID=980116 RepID=A0A8H6IC11_9AGAR|nr:hypothetical protein DFP72DRAFT_879139 [Tulosesus angulatus]